MIETSIQIPRKEKPVLIDKAIQAIQDLLTSNLPWLDYAFGRAYSIMHHRRENPFEEPSAYVGNGEYISLLPNDNFGNFSWIDVYDPQDIDTEQQAKVSMTLRGALVFWYKQTSIYPDTSALYTEEVKEEILKVLSTPGGMPPGNRLTVTKVFEEFGSIYRGYDLRSIDQQFFMHPYAGLRIEFELNTMQLCY